jgi:anhydro-N-acetylmuramic acid kinase
MGIPFDEDGRIAASGTPDVVAMQALEILFAKQSTMNRSLGTGDEVVHWVQMHHHVLAAADLAATAVHAMSRHIAKTLKNHQVDEAILAGGGARNMTLIRAIAKESGIPVRLTDEHGVPIEAREAVCFAVLGALCADGVPITLPQVTGCAAPAPLSGVWHRA